MFKLIKFEIFRFITVLMFFCIFFSCKGIPEQTTSVNTTNTTPQETLVQEREKEQVQVSAAAAAEPEPQETAVEAPPEIPVQFDSVFTVTAANEWTNALTAISQGGSGTANSLKIYAINVNGNFQIPGTKNNIMSFGTADHIKVTLAGSGIITLSSSGSIINLRNNQTFIIDGENISLRGFGDNDRAVFFIYGGTLELKTGTISNNFNSYTGLLQSKAGFHGGGVFVGKLGTFNMTGGNVANNTSYIGGGVFVDGGTFILSDGKINNNNAANNGGGVNAAGIFTMSGGIIGNNSSARGGGVCITGETSFLLKGGSINNNEAFAMGGGVYINGNKAAFIMEDGLIRDNTNIGSISGGGGVCVSGGSFVLRKGTISGNTNNSIAGGGGVFVYESASFVMENGNINGNKSNGRNARGGGVCVYINGTFNMLGGVIGGNTASSGGGGLCISDGTFMKTGGIIYGNNERTNSNTSGSGEGHAVFGNNWDGSTRRNATVGSNINYYSHNFWEN